MTEMLIIDAERIIIVKNRTTIISIRMSIFSIDCPALHYIDYYGHVSCDYCRHLAIGFSRLPYPNKHFAWPVNPFVAPTITIPTD